MFGTLLGIGVGPGAAELLTRARYRGYPPDTRPAGE